MTTSDINYKLMDNSSTLQTEELKDKTIESFKSRHEDLKRFYDTDRTYEEDDNIWDYFLCIDIGYDKYVRLQISWGGPQEEFRIFKDGHIEYCFLNWFQGYSLDVTDNKIAQWLKDDIIEMGFSYNGDFRYTYKELFEQIELVKIENEE